MHVFDGGGRFLIHFGREGAGAGEFYIPAGLAWLGSHTGYTAVATNDESFALHWRPMQVASCATCHDPHGVPSGGATNHGSLINFDLNIVAPASDGTAPCWADLTPAPDATVFQGSCRLTCHGVDHRDAAYWRSAWRPR